MNHTATESVAAAMVAELQALRALVDVLPEPLFAKDAAGRYVVANAALARWAGRPAAEVLGRTDGELFDAETARARAEGDRLAAATEGVVGRDEISVHEGETRTYRTSRRVHRDAQGRGLGVVGFSRRADSGAPAFLEHLPCPAAIKDDGGRYLFVNRAAEVVMGLPAGLWLGRTDGELWQVHYEAACQRADRAVLAEGRPISFASDFPDARGDLRSWRVVEFPVPDGEGGVRVAVLAMDLTDHGVRPAALVGPTESVVRESERLAMSALDSHSGHIAVLDETGLILAVNRAWRTFAAENGATGLVSEGANYLDACASSLGEAARDACSFGDGIRDVLAGRRESFEQEYPCLSPTGRRWFVGRVAPFRGAGPPRVVVAHEEISGQRRAERALGRSSRRLENLHALDQAILAARSPEQVAAAALDFLARLVPCSPGGAAIFEFAAGEARLLARRGGRPPRVRAGRRVPLSALDREGLKALGEGRVWSSTVPPGPSDPWAEGTPSFVRLPVRHGGELIGALHLGADRPDLYSAEELAIARELADLLAIAIRQALLFEEVDAAKGVLGVLAHRLVHTEEDERRRIARDLHDEVGQGLTAAKIALQGSLRDRGAAAAEASIREAMTLIDETLRQVRDIALELRPCSLDDLGLADALRALIRRQARHAGFEAEFLAAEPAFRVHTDLETACYRVAQEALTNIVRHAGAARARVSLGFEPGWMLLEVRDDGRGFDVAVARARAARGASLGLLGMEERATILGGKIRIESSPGRGAVVHAAFPLDGKG